MLLATSYSQPDTVSLYNIVLFVHILAAIVAFGVTFAYPIIYAVLRKPANRQHLPLWHRVQVQVGTKVIAPASTVVLLAGIYLAASGPYKFSSAFVGVGLAVIVVLMGLGGAFFAPTDRKAGALAERDVGAAGGGSVTLSPEYEAVAQRLMQVGGVYSLLVVFAVFMMVMKLGAAS